MKRVHARLVDVLLGAAHAPLAQQALALGAREPGGVGALLGIDLVAGPVRVARAGRRRPGSRGRSARRPSSCSRCRASARVRTCRCAPEVGCRRRAASSSVTAPNWPKTIGVGEVRFRSPSSDGADAQHHRRRCAASRARARSGRAGARRACGARPRRSCSGTVSFRQRGAAQVERERAEAARVVPQVRGVARRDRHRVACSAPRARRRRRAPRWAARARRSAAAPTPGRASPSPRACRRGSRRRARRSPSRSRTPSPTAPAPASVAQAEQRAARLGQQHDAALAGRDAVLALGREDQPRGEVHERRRARRARPPSAKPSRTRAGRHLPAPRQAGAHAAEPAADGEGG